MNIGSDLATASVLAVETASALRGTEAAVEDAVPAETS